MIKGEKKKILNSILSRPWKKVCIDKIIIQDAEKGKTKELITDPKEIKAETDKFFAEQFRKRKHHFEDMTEEWKKEYEPKREIQEEWYEEVTKNIEEEEWKQSLDIAKGETAPGASGISYIMLSKAGPIAT